MQYLPCFLAVEVGDERADGLLVLERGGEALVRDGAPALAPAPLGGRRALLAPPPRPLLLLGLGPAPDHAVAALAPLLPERGPLNPRNNE